MLPACEPCALLDGTVRADSLASIVENYDNIQLLWETASRATSDTEMKARIQGMNSQMQCFKFLFCLILSEMILRHTDKLSQTLQQPRMSSIEGHEVAMLTVKPLKACRRRETLIYFGKRLSKRGRSWTWIEAHLTRRRKKPKRFDQDSAPTEPSEHALTAKDEYHQVYSEAIDLAVTSSAADM